jgi:hypothetical protein
MAHGSWQRWSMVDWATAGPRGSPELGLAAAPGHGDLLMMAQWRERSMRSPSRDNSEHGQWRGDQATAVKKWQWWCSVQVAHGHGEKRRWMGRGAVDDGEAGAALTRAREAVRWSGDDGKAVVVEEPGGGGAQARRGEEEGGDRCSEGRARAFSFFRGGREVDAPGTQWLASMPGLEDVGYSE